MSSATDQHKALVTYCAEHTCATCPVSDPALACIEPTDYCVVSHALDKLEPLAVAEGAII